MLSNASNDAFVIPAVRNKDMLAANKIIAANYSSLKPSLLQLMSKVETARIEKCLDKKRQLLQFKASHTLTLSQRNLEWKARVSFCQAEIRQLVQPARSPRREKRDRQLGPRLSPKKIRLFDQESDRHSKAQNDRGEWHGSAKKLNGASSDCHEQRP